MKNYFLLIGFCTFLGINAQIELETPWMKELKSSQRGPLTFNAIVTAGNTYWETHNKEAKGSGYKPFKRWEAQWENYVDVNGFLPSTENMWNSWEQKTLKKQLRTASSAAMTSD